MTLVEHLLAGANDPMWADHCEMPKRIALAAADEIVRLWRIEAAAAGRDFIGIEMDPAFFNMARDRLASVHQVA